jgi:hypothetical protein
LKRTEAPSHRKCVPDFWWDFAHNPSAVIVESSDDRHPVIARFPLVDGVDAEPLIEKATSLIEDLKAGRVTQKQAMLTHYA